MAQWKIAATQNLPKFGLIFRKGSCIPKESPQKRDLYSLRTRLQITSVGRIGNPPCLQNGKLFLHKALWACVIESPGLKITEINPRRILNLLGD